MMHPQAETTDEVLRAYGIKAIETQIIDAGLINTTYRIKGDKASCYILQSVNARFPAEINHDIDIVTRHLQRSGLITPRLVLTREGEVFHRRNNRIWRMFDYIEGKVFHRLNEARQARAAGEMLAKVHVALDRLDDGFAARHSHVHDTPRHLAHLRDTLLNKSAHRRYETIKGLGEAILQLSKGLPQLPAVRERMVHGDPKISNFIFSSENNTAICMVDFDTLGKMPIYMEIADALRSWCNPSGEDRARGYFSLKHCHGALEGYANYAASLLTTDEWCAILPATLTVFIELAARFCADALNENYFSWDAEKFSSHSEHSEIRARGQLNAAHSLLSQYDEINGLMADLFSR